MEWTTPLAAYTTEFAHCSSKEENHFRLQFKIHKDKHEEHTFLHKILFHVFQVCFLNIHYHKICIGQVIH